MRPRKGVGESKFDFAYSGSLLGSQGPWPTALIEREDRGTQARSLLIFLAPFCGMGEFGRHLTVEMRGKEEREINTVRG